MRWIRLAIALVAATVFGAAQSAGTDAPAIETKTVPAQTFLVYHAQIKSLDEVGPIEWSTVPRMKRFLESHGFTPLPQMEYHVDFEGENITDVNVARYAARGLAIAFPVAKAPDDLGRYTIKSAPAYKCLSLVFTGPGLESGKHWTKLYEYAKSRKIPTSGENREIQLARGAGTAGDYVTELQLGIR